MIWGVAYIWVVLNVAYIMSCVIWFYGTPRVRWEIFYWAFILASMKLYAMVAN